jgi:hypothetical protein
VAGGNVQVVSTSGVRCKVQGWQNIGATVRVFVNCFDTSGVLSNSAFAVFYARRTNTPGIEGGYAWADQQTSASYAPSATYRWNSTGQPVTITRAGTGNYMVTFAGQNSTGKQGTVQVTAYGTGSSFCKVGSWGGPSVNVRCFANGGTPADSRFTVAYNQRSPNNAPSFSYLWANDPTAASYTPAEPWRSFFIESDPGCFLGLPPSTVARIEVGRYTVRFPGFTSADGFRFNAMVTAYGSGPETCVSSGPFDSGSGALVNVSCFDTAESRADTRFAVTLSSNQHNRCP